MCLQAGKPWCLLYTHAEERAVTQHVVLHIPQSVPDTNSNSSFGSCTCHSFSKAFTQVRCQGSTASACNQFGTVRIADAQSTTMMLQQAVRPLCP
jgi:hypothetical protein